MKARRKRCKSCKELFTPTYSTVQMVCSTKCAYKYSKRLKEETKEKNDKALNVLEKEKLERKTLTSLKNSLKQICHEYIRLRDKGKPCISCGTAWHPDFQAGHFYKAELFSSLKFNELNIHGQCVQCNIRKEGNLNDYELNLPKRITQYQFDILKSIANVDKISTYKWDREHLKNLRTYYRNKLKELKE